MVESSSRFLKKFAVCVQAARDTSLPLPIPSSDEPIGKNYEKMFSEVFRNKKYWHSSLNKLYNDEAL
jgi:hypothetical protein